MMFTLLVRANKTFSGPFTDDPAPAAWETRVVLTTQQKTAWDSFVAANPGQLVRLFDGGAFRLATADEAASTADTLQKALIALYGKIPTIEQAGRFLRLYGALTTLFAIHGPNGGALRPIMRAAIEGTDVSGDEDLTAIKADMLALDQWNL